MKAILATTTATLALTLAAPAFAQDAQADTANETAQADASAIVVTGTLSEFGAIKSDTPIVEVARSISIETQQDFVIKGAQSLDDALTYTAGVTAEPFGFSTRGDFV
ncbi:MAG TPA: TonB-dependent siderophore receptor, partial [Erythrobacter sp.]|nr:TonB-dependent siderophore receptor [Erythrobacter sp.]